MIVSINQPAYIPWLGYFDRILKSDLHVVLNHVQFEKNSVTNRNKVRTSQGWTWLTVPLCTKGRFGNLAIQELEVNTSETWESKHWKTFLINYSRTPYFAEYASFFENLYQRKWDKLATLIEEINSHILQMLEIETRLVYSSELVPQGKKADLILELCKKLGATTYLSGPMGRNYLKEESFDSAGIKLQFHDYPHPEYKQAYPGFEPYMSVIDLLFNHGPKSLDILRS